MKKVSLIGMVTFLGLFVYFYKILEKFWKSIMAAFILTCRSLESKAADAFTPQQQTSRVEKNMGLVSHGAIKPNNNGQGKPNGSDGCGDGDIYMPQYPQVESVQETEKRLDNIDKLILRMEQNSDFEPDSEKKECEATEEKKKRAVLG